MYYRVAIQVDASPTWKWKSTVMISLNNLLHWLPFYRAIPHDLLRIFSSSSREDLNEQLMRENKGLESNSVTAAQFLQERMICSPEVGGGASAGGTQGNERTAPIAVAIGPSPNESSWGVQTPDERGISALEKRRGELERAAGGDHDLPYSFTLPTSFPQVLAWVKLLAQVQNGALQL
jgi:hypothetical protein